VDLAANNSQELSRPARSDAPGDLSEDTVLQRVLNADTALPRRLDHLASFIEKDTKLMGRREDLRTHHRAIYAHLGITEPADTAMTSAEKMENRPVIRHFLAQTSRQLLHAHFLQRQLTFELLYYTDARSSSHVIEDFAIPGFVHFLGEDYFPDLNGFNDFTRNCVRSEYEYKDVTAEQEGTGHVGPQVGVGLDPTQFMVFLTLLDQNHFDEEWG
jgi:hypothetical protein